MEGIMSSRIVFRLSMICPNSWGGKHGFLLEVREVQVLKEWGNAGGWQQSTENPSPSWLLGLQVYMTFRFNLLELIVSTVMRFYFLFSLFSILSYCWDRFCLETIKLELSQSCLIVLYKLWYLIDSGTNLLSHSNESNFTF